MKHCPTCGAEYKGKRRCYRCRMDLARLLDLEQDALKHQENARAAYEDSNYETMHCHAARACSLHCTSDALLLLACAALLTNRFEQAFSLYEKLDKHDINSIENNLIEGAANGLKGNPV